MIKTEKIDRPIPVYLFILTLAIYNLDLISNDVPLAQNKLERIVIIAAKDIQ